MNLITTLVIAIATSLTGVSAVSSLRGVADTFEDQVAVALGGHRKQDCVDNCQYWWGVSKQSCKDCCKQGGNTCDPETLGGMCGVECRVDGDCRNGGLIMCGTCNTVGGTRYVNTCIADNETPEPPPSPWDRCATDNVGRSAGLDRPERAKRRQSAAPTTSDHSNTSASTSANLVPPPPRPPSSPWDRCATDNVAAVRVWTGRNAPRDGKVLSQRLRIIRIRVRLRRRILSHSFPNANALGISRRSRRSMRQEM